jgi:hypothetical protein
MQAVEATEALRRLGHVILCGALHVAYPTSDAVKGAYMMCTLYRKSLLLASVHRESGAYRVTAIISLVNATVDSAQNGRGMQHARRIFLMTTGLQCHTSRFTWKLIFLADGREYEILLSACSEKEEDTWKDQLRGQIAIEPAEFANCGDCHDLLSMNLEDIKALGREFVASGRLCRKLSIRRSATTHPKSRVQQVIIKNTEAPKYTNSLSFFAVVRSQSHLSPNHVPVLAPRRHERMRLENAIADVWTKQSLRYPAMGRGDNTVRASASSVMRKLSMSSIGRNLSKRSTSH